MGSGGGGAAVPLWQVCHPAAGPSPSADPALHPLRPRHKRPPGIESCGALREIVFRARNSDQRWLTPLAGSAGAGVDSPPPAARFQSCSTVFPEGSARPVLAQAHVEMVEKALIESVMEMVSNSD